MALEEPDNPDAPPTAAEERSWLRSTALWAVVGAASSLLTGLFTLGAVIVAAQQLQESRELALRDAAYASWNALNQASLDNPEFACPDTPEKFNKLMTTADPKSLTGGTYQDRYAIYGNLMITTFEQILQMAPNDPYWRFRIRDRLRCNAPAIRFLRQQGTYEQRYSCQLRQVIAEEMSEPAVSCSS